MARKTKKASKNYPNAIIFDENLEEKYPLGDYIDWGWNYETRVFVNEWISIPQLKMF